MSTTAIAGTIRAAYVRLSAVWLMLVLAILTLVGAAFLWAIGQHALLERHPFQFFADSNTYLRIYRGEQWLANDAMLSVSDNYVGPMLMLRLLGGNIYLVMVANVAMYSHAVLRITRLLNLDPLKIGLALLLSPLTVSSLLSVNKEIFIFPFMALALTAYIRRSLSIALLAIAVSVLVRWQLTVFCIAMLGVLAAVSLFRSRALVLAGLLVAISVAYLRLTDTFAPVLEVVERSILEDLDQGSGLYARLLEYQNRGLYVIVFPLKAMHLLFAKGLMLERVFSPNNVYNDVFVALHSTACIIVAAMLLYMRKLTVRSDLILASTVFLIVFCISPVYAPRYLYPAFVAAVLVIAGAPTSIPRGGRTRSASKERLLVPEGS